MRGDSLEFPYCRFFCLVVLNMVEDLVVCDDLFRLIVVNGAKELDPGGIVFYLPIMIFDCSYDTCSMSLSVLHWVHQERLANKVAGVKNGHGCAMILFVITGIRLVTRFYDYYGN
jgi:hypothetical protein